MAGRAGRMAMLVGTVLLGLPLPVWAGSTQAALAVGVAVSARCAVSMPGTMAPTELLARAREAVAMRCTKGTLPTGPGSAATPGAVGPQITRSLVLPTGAALSAAPRPLSEISPLAVAEANAPRVVITINF